MRCTPGLALGEACFAALSDGGLAPEEFSFIGAHAMTSVIALVTMPPFEREPSVKGDVRRGAEGRPDECWPSLDSFPKSR